MATLYAQWFGRSALRLTVKHDVGEVTVITDPFDTDGSLKLPRGVSADLVVATHPLTSKDRDLVGGDPFRIDHAGEFEVKGIFVYGVPARAGAGKDDGETVYRIEAGDVTIAYLGDIHKEPDDAALESLTDADILIVPVGGQGQTLTAAEAAAIMTRLEPRIVVPVAFKTPGGERPADAVEKFVKEAGLVPEKVEKLKITKKDLPEEETKLFILSV